MKTLINLGNIATAVAALGASIALGLIAAHPIYRALVGIAVVTAVVSIGILLNRKFGARNEAAGSGDKQRKPKHTS